MAAEPPVPRVVKAADTRALLALEHTAEVLGLNQRLLPSWLDANVAPTGPGRYLAQALPPSGGLPAFAV